MNEICLSDICEPSWRTVATAQRQPLGRHRQEQKRSPSTGTRRRRPSARFRSAPVRLCISLALKVALCATAVAPLAMLVNAALLVSLHESSSSASLRGFKLQKLGRTSRSELLFLGSFRHFSTVFVRFRQKETPTTNRSMVNCARRRRKNNQPFEFKKRVNTPCRVRSDHIRSWRRHEVRSVVDSFFCVVRSR